MADLKAQLAISADASGVEAGVKNAKRSLADLGQTAANAGKQGSEGLDAIGKGGDRSSAKVDAATKNMIGSIQRTTAAMEAGGRTSSKYYETLAAQRGIDPNALKPYLTQLDAVAAKQTVAGAALKSSGIQFDKYGMSAKQTAFALRGLPAQFSDIAISLQAGQNPLSVFLQQGSQLKDMFGGIGPAARAMAGYIAGLINPFTIAAAAAGVLAFAYNRGSKEADAYGKALILTGNAAGSSVGQLDAMARSIDGVVGTQSAAAEALALFAANGAIAGQNIERFTTIAIRMERVAGQAISETVKQFAELGKAPLDASVKLNESMRHLTRTTYEQIKALEQQGRIADAAALAQKTYADALENRSGQIESQLGTIERAWRGIKDGAKEAWDAMLGIGRKDSIQKQLDAVSKEIAKAREPFDANPWSGNAEARAKLPQNLALQASLQEMLRLETRGAEAAKAAADQVKARIDFDKDGEKYLDRRLKLEREISEARAKGLAAGASQKEINDRIAAITAKYTPKASGAAPAKGVEAENPLDAFRRSEISGTDAVNRAADQAKWGDIAKARRAASDEQERLNGLIAATPTGQIEKQRETMLFLAAAFERGVKAQKDFASGAINDEQLAEVFRRGAITAEQFNEAATTALGNIAPAAKEAGEAIDQFSIQAARNIQTSLGDTLNKTLRGDFKGIGDLWKRTLLDMAAQAQAAKLNKWLFGADFGKTGDVGGALGGLFKDIGGLFGGATKMATGTNYVPRDNFPALLHKGEAVVPARYNPANGGAGGGSFSPSISIYVDSRSDQEQVGRIAYEASSAAVGQFAEQLRAQGAIA